ncbi:LpxI family protein [Camelimonas abortus]|uniref:LpxI family protein n=1 Tax=Camelimonas abortus TaxID=1017184 RepID=A0ABV7LGG4_9HYPH
MDGPVAIVAGGGALPLELAAALHRRGRRARILALRGFASGPARRAADAAHAILDARGVLATLTAWRPAAVALVGHVHRPGPLALLGAYSAFRSRDLIARLAASGDDGLLRGVVGLLEEHGFRVAGVHELAPELLAGEGRLGRVLPVEMEAAARGAALLEALSPFDVGQAVAVSGARVCAVEGPEGTDAMIRRVRRLWGGGRLPRSERRPVLVKAAKRGQDLRIDIPVIGPRTIRNAAAAGFAGVALRAGQTLILDRARTIAEADRRGLFLFGYGPELAALAGGVTEEKP